MSNKINFKKAFTMAEAILVMTILGIIATIMISTLKPAQFKEEGLLIMAKKVLYEVDNAMTQIIVNDTKYGKIDYLVDATGTFAFKDSPSRALELMKKYMVTTRATVQSAHCTGSTAILKNGACIGLATSASVQTIFPGEETAAAASTPAQGIIYIDTNDNKEPNIVGKDRFVIPLDAGGIIY